VNNQDSEDSAQKTREIQSRHSVLETKATSAGSIAFSVLLNLNLGKLQVSPISMLLFVLWFVVGPKCNKSLYAEKLDTSQFCVFISEVSLYCTFGGWLAC